VSTKPGETLRVRTIQSAWRGYSGCDWQGGFCHGPILLRHSGRPLFFSTRGRAWNAQLQNLLSRI